MPGAGRARSRDRGSPDRRERGRVRPDRLNELPGARFHPLEDGLRVHPDPHDAGEQRHEHGDLAEREVGELLVHTLVERIENHPLQRREQVHRGDDHAGRGDGGRQGVRPKRAEQHQELPDEAVRGRKPDGRQRDDRQHRREHRHGLGVRRDRQDRADARGGADDRLAVVHRASGHERLRRGVPGAARDVADVPPAGHHRHGRRGRRRDVPAPGAAARDFQSARQEREREARRPFAPRDRRARAVARLHRVDRGVPEAHPPTDGTERPAARSVGAGERGLVHGGPVSLDLATSRDLLRALLPELMLTLVGLALLLVIAWRHRTAADLRVAGWVTLAGFATAGAAAWWLWWHTARAIGAPAMIAVDDFRFVADWLLLGTAGLTVLVSFDYLERERLLVPEYHALLLFATLGMMLMVGGEDLMVVFLGLELMSVAVYALAGINRHSPAAAEAALKYFLLGAFASGFLLYGIALVYGATAATNLSQIGAQVRTFGLADSPMLLIGLGLLLVGFGFKVAAVPFHMWAPDVYDGSPTPVTGFMATAVKAAAFAALLRVLGEAFGGVPAWHQIVWWLAVATMVVGNLVALAQRTVKRMLAYSSIAHAGYLLVAVATGTSAGSAAFIFYLVAYTLTTLAAFALLAAKGRDGERDVRIDDLAGLGTRRPWLAFALAVCMLSLLGFPGTAGFIGKWYVLVAATAAGQLPLAAILVLTSVISAGYYLPVIMAMYMQPEPFEQAHTGMRIGRLGGAVVAVSVAGLLVLGIRPNRLLDLAKTSGDGLRPVPAITTTAPPSTGR